MSIKSGLIFSAVSLLIAMTSLHAQIYRYEDYEGRTYLTDKPMHGKRFSLVKRYDFGYARKDWTPTLLKRRRAELSPLIEQIASEMELQPELIHAVVRAESAYDAQAESPKGALGLMQLMPATAQRYNVGDITDPEQNLKGGSRYLRDLLDQFDDNLELALAAYNAGENRVIQYGYQIPPYPETRNYVSKVLKWYEQGIN